MVFVLCKKIIASAKITGKRVYVTIVELAPEKNREVGNSAIRPSSAAIMPWVRFLKIA